MRRTPLGAIALVLLLSPASPRLGSATPYDDLFTADTMRIDYSHTGGRGIEAVSVDRIVNDGPWAGSRARLVDDTNLGKYLFEVVDRRTNRVVYSRGFASLFGEWETTPEARDTYRTFGGSLRFPWPRQPVQVVLKKRDRLNAFHEFWSTLVDPASRAVNRARLAPTGRVWTLWENGPPESKVDLLLIGDGYTEAELPKFHADAKRLVDRMFTVEPYKSRRSDFNVRAIDVAAAESGVHNPRTGDMRRARVGTEYNIFDSERYALSPDNRGWRDVASEAPYDAVGILINNRYYGGGGIFNDQATVAVDSGSAEYIFIHEFGHHFAGLGDEYYTSDVAYETGAAEKVEPWEPNVTALLDPSALKWKDLVDPGTPLPTPWDKAEYEKRSAEIQAERRRLRASAAPESAMDALFARQLDFEKTFLSSMKYSGRVGAFEGASYEPTGLYRPETDCIMFSRNPAGFCRVCRRAIERVIDLHTGR
ncbi:MAG TPA: IgA Peptidase M64 [Vicinamibacterales bacterium]|nr:IgA Peptidase M64 [Vicinamibacterales bacterium]